jgi:hypothetical protein
MTWPGSLLELVVLLEFGGAAVAEGSVQPGAVVPGDVFDDGASGTSPGGPWLLVEALALERGEERLGQDARHVSRAGPTRANQSDVEHPPVDLAVWGSSPSRRAPSRQVYPPVQ